MKLSIFLSRCVIAFALLGAALGPLSAGAAGKNADTQVAVVAPININTASAEIVSQTLNGVGMKRAQAIVDYRKKHGRFASFEDLQQVKGIGKAVIEKNRGLITFR